MSGRRRSAQRPAALALSQALALTLALVLPGCSRGEPPAPAFEGADPDRGRRLLSTFGCIACHRIPEVPGRSSPVGPPLERLSERAFLAGRLPNTPEALVRWITAPQEVDPRNAMPDLGVSEDEARDMAAYLYQVR